MVRKLQLWPNVYPLQANSIAHHDFLLLGLEVVEEDGALLRLLTPILDDNARAVDNLAGISLTIQNACEPISIIPKSKTAVYTHRDQPILRAAFRLGP